MNQMRHETLTWNEVDKLIDHLLPQFQGDFEPMVIITRGGIIPGGLLAEATGIPMILTAAVDFPAEVERQKAGLFAWPRFIEFPNDELLHGKRCLVVDDVWGSGRTITAVKNRIESAGGIPFTCVLHFNPHRTLFGTLCPDYYAAITDAYIVYPWESGHNRDKVRLG
jgi:hypoxanthine phosphoribosyltransferase